MNSRTAHVTDHLTGCCRGSRGVFVFVGGRGTGEAVWGPSPPVLRAFLQAAPQIHPRVCEGRAVHSCWLLKGKRACETADWLTHPPLGRVLKVTELA